MLFSDKLRTKFSSGVNIIVFMLHTVMTTMLIAQNWVLCGLKISNALEIIAQMPYLPLFASLFFGTLQNKLLWISIVVDIEWTKFVVYLLYQESLCGGRLGLLLLLLRVAFLICSKVVPTIHSTTNTQTIVNNFQRGDIKQNLCVPESTKVDKLLDEYPPHALIRQQTFKHWT